MIRIISLKEGFRRAGVAHPARPVDYPDGRFDKKQLEELQAERMLVVQVLPDGEPGGKGKKGG